MPDRDKRFVRLQNSPHCPESFMNIKSDLTSPPPTSCTTTFTSLRMSADDQNFLDTLSSVPNDIKRYSADVADYIDSHLERVSNTLREALSSSQWLPESARPRPPPPPPRSFIETVTPRSPIYTQIYNWVQKNKILTTAIVIVAGGAAYYVVRRKSHRKKRRAKKANNGARLEVVVIAGSPSEPMTRSISMDLERRGFIVYVVCNTIEEEVQVQNESRPDIKPLMIDIVDPASARASIERFTTHLQAPHAAFQGAKPHYLIFRSLILLPSTNYPSSPIATLSPSSFSDLLNTRLLTPILTLQTFLPLLQSLPVAHLTSATRPSVLVLTPNIISSLNPAFHLPESSIVSALNSFAEVLSAELVPLSIPVTHLQLGTFDFSAFASHNKQLQTIPAQRAETLKWDDSARQAYGRNFVAVSTSSNPLVGKGSSLRELNNAVFDALVRGKGGVVRVGMGSSVYGFVGRWVPRGLVGWMMGVRKVSHEHDFGGKSGAGSVNGSRSTSPGSNVHGMDHSDYINVDGENGFDVDSEFMLNRNL